MRQFIIYFLALLFTGGGLFAIGGGIAFEMEKANQDDFYAALFMGAMLLIIGVTLFTAGRKMARRQKAETDAGMASGVMMGHMMNMEDGGGDGGDDGGSDGDVGGE